MAKALSSARPARPALPIGLRIREAARPGRTAMIIGKPEHERPGLSLIWVQIEGSTRREHWATHRLAALPTEDQFRKLGGQVDAPAGYPLIPVPHASAG